MHLNNSSDANETLRWTPELLPDHTKITLYSILLVWSLLGNVLIIAVVYCNQNLRTNMNYLIVNMAVSDLLVPLIALPMMISSEKVSPKMWIVEGHLGEALCKLVPFLSDISPYVSSINLAIIASQRFIIVVYPTRRQILTHKTRRILISVPWIIAMALLSPYFYAYRLTNDGGYMTCSFSWSPDIFYSVLIVVGFVIPLIAIIILYTIMNYKLRKSLNNVMELIDRKMICSQQQRNRRLFGMSITIGIVFTMCWCPLWVLYLLFASEHPLIRSMEDETLDKMHFAFIYLWLLLPAINPCIYFVFLRDFRRGLKRLCCRETT